MKFKNEHKIPVPIAAWLVSDKYDFVANRYRLSASDFTKSMKQTILSRRYKENKIQDVTSLFASRSGSAIHDSIEEVWTNEDLRKKALKSLGYKDELVDRMLVNPKKEEIQEDSICLYFEQRGEVNFGEYVLSGKFDMVFNGNLCDIKNVSSYAVENLSEESTHKYMVQGSIYRYIFQDIIKSDVITIFMLVRDWNASKADKIPTPIYTIKVPLMTIEETEDFIKEKLEYFDTNYDVDDDELVECSQQDLWQGNPKYKYYKKEDAKRATKASDSYEELLVEKAKNNNVGVIKTFFGQAKACLYCDAYKKCKQSLRLIDAELLKDI